MRGSTACPAANASAAAWRACCCRRPQVFLVDEPLSALDPALSQLTLATLQQEAGTRATPP